ncbi:MAG TPA: glycosyltransferase 87 family protein, partial [Acidimicrobiales bacterium]
MRAALTGRRAPVLAGLVVGLAVVHAVVVGRHYFVGSFDDDAGYIVVARALAHGQGLTSRLSAGYPLVSTYPPGYGALLAPIARIDGSAFLAFRALSVVALVVLLPLVWTYLGRRRVSDPARLAVLLLLALNPVLATFSTMVMAELPFLVAFLLLLLAVERWEASPRVMTWAGAATVVAAAASVWLKEAALGLVAGLVVWLALRRLWRKAAVTAGGTAVLFAPVIIARLIAGGSLIGSRYATEFGAAFAGGIGHQVTSAIPSAVATYLNSAIPQSIVPTSVSPLPVVGPVAGVLGTLGTTVTPLVLIGLVVWWRRHRDAAAVMVPFYVVTTLAYPFVNERRLIIVLPVIVAWYVLGAGAVIKAVTAAGRWFGREMAGRLVAWAPALVVIAVLVPQFGRDYLYALGQDSSRPQGSPYMAMLHDLGPPSEVVESDFLWSTNLFSGHPTAESAYLVAVDNCYAPELNKAIEQDGAGLVLTG